MNERLKYLEKENRQL
jgi:hypothetical protein